MTLSNKLNLYLYSELTGQIGLSEVKAKITEQINSLLTGSDALFSVSAEITDSSDSYDLDGSLTDPLGNIVTFSKVTGLFIRNNSEHAMTLGGANHIPILADGSDRLNIPAGGYWFFVDETGITVTAETGDLIIVNGTTTDSYDLVVWGIAPA